MANYNNVPGWLDAFQKIKDLQHGSGYDNDQEANQLLSQYGDLFVNQYQQASGGATPDANALSRFFSEVVAPQGTFPGGSNPGIPQLTQLVNNFIGSSLGRNIEQQQKAKLTQDAAGKSGNVNSVFKELLGRDATQAESEHFGKLLASGDVDDYTLRSFLQQTPEYVRPRLEKQDTQYFTESLLPAIQSDFARRGRSVDASGFAAALANSSKDLTRERDRYVEGIGREDYQNYVGRMYGNQDYNRARADSLADYSRNRADQIYDYQTQKSAYDEYLRNYGRRKKSTGLGSGIGSLAGMGLGALLALPTGGVSVPVGAMLGGTMGSAGGGIAEESFM